MVKTIVKRMGAAAIVIMMTLCLGLSDFAACASAADSLKGSPAFSGFESKTNSVTLKWKKFSGASGYRVYRKTSKGWTKLTTLSGSSKLSYTDKNVSAGKTYSYKVKAYKKQNGKTLWSSASKAFNAAAKPVTVKLDKYNYTYNAVRLKWNTVDCSGYEIYQKKSGKWIKIADVKDPKQNNYRVNGLDEGTGYSFKMRAYTAYDGDKKIVGNCGSQDVITKSSDPVEDKLLRMTLHEKVCQMFIVTPEQIEGSKSTVTSSGSGIKSGLNKYPVGGVIYFADNLVSVTQTQTMISRAQKYAKDSCGIGMFVTVDEEGGSVARCAQKLGTTSFRSMEYYGSLGDSGKVKNIGKTIGSDISALGFNVDFAPVADVDINPDNELGNRIFSSDPKVVAKMTSAFVSGIQSTGVSATLKHFPGLGAAGGNTHYDGYVYVSRTMSQLRNNEFIAFKGGIGADADFVMVGHAVYSAANDNLPADMSETVVTDWLRKELAYDGIAVTDSQSMAAITKKYTSGKAAITSINAGMDIILCPKNMPSAIYDVEKAVNDGTVSEDRIDESVRRILTVKYKKGLFK